jgi:hypothetical protein
MWLRTEIGALSLLWRAKGVRKSTESEHSRTKIEHWQSDILPTWVKRG